MTTYTVTVVTPESINLNDIRIYLNGLDNQGLNFQEFLELALTWKTRLDEIGGSGNLLPLEEYE